MTDPLMPYDVIFEQKGAATLTITPSQVQTGKTAATTRHHLEKGTYMLSVAYDGPEKLEIKVDPNVTIGTIPAGTKGIARTAMVPKIAAPSIAKTLYMTSTPAGDTADPAGVAVLSVFPAEMYDPETAV